MTTRLTGRRRRPALVAGAVVTLAAASAAGSLVPGATAAPATTAPAAAAPAASAVLGDSATGLRARTRDGQFVAVPSGPRAAASRSIATRTSSALAASPAAAAAAAIKPPAYSALGATGVVVSASPSLAFAPDGSRVAWSTSTGVFTSRPGGSAPVTVLKTTNVQRLAWQPSGRFIAIQKKARGITVASAAHQQVFDTSDLPTARAAVSWLDPVTLVTIDAGTFDIVDLYDATRRRYTAPAGTSVLEATASPDGTRVVVSRKAAAGGEELTVVDAATLTDVATVVTTTGTFGRPTWSADSATVYAARTQDGATSIVSHAAGTADGEPTVVLADASRTPYVYLRPTGAGKATGTRLTGRDAIAVSVARSKDAFSVTRAGSCDVVGGATAAVLAASGSVEATIGAPLAANKCGPLLLTGKRSLDSRTAAELKRLLSRGRTVYLVGNTTSLSASVATAVTRLGFKAVRYGGADVYTTAVVVATKGWKDRSVAGIASASQPLAAAVASATTVGSVPLLLTKGTAMPKVTNAYITKYRTAAFVVGSQGAKAAPWAYKYVGANDIATALKVATGDYWPAYTVALVSTRDLSYVYAAAADATLRGYPLLYVAPGSLGTPNRTYVNATSASVDRVFLYASTRLVSSAVLTDAVKQAAGRNYP